MSMGFTERESRLALRDHRSVDLAATSLLSKREEERIRREKAMKRREEAKKRRKYGKAANGDYVNVLTVTRILLPFPHLRAENHGLRQEISDCCIKTNE